jgi:hypothetical protein
MATIRKLSEEVANITQDENLTEEEMLDAIDHTLNDSFKNDPHKSLDDMVEEIEKEEKIEATKTKKEIPKKTDKENNTSHLKVDEKVNINNSISSNLYSIDENFSYIEINT